MNLTGIYSLGGRGVYSTRANLAANSLFADMNIGSTNTSASTGTSLSVNKLGLEFSKDLSQKAKALQTSISDLNKISKSALAPKSGNTEVLEASSKSPIAAAFKNDEINVNVMQAATKQNVESVSLSNTGKDLGVGTMNLNLNVGGKNTTITADIKSSDNNSTALAKIAEQINKAGVGVTASVVKGEKAGESRLMIEAEDTGTGANGAARFSINSFTVGGQDVSQKTGINNDNMTEAQNARYTVDGGAVRESASNTVDIGRGVTATLKQEGTSTITFGQDSSRTVSAMQDFVDAFNDFTNFLQSNAGSYPGADKLLSDVTNAIASNRSLKDAGLSFDGTTLTMDSARVSKAAEGRGVSEFAIGATSGVGSKIAQAVSKPAQFVNNNSAQNGGGTGMYNQSGGYDMTELIINVNQNMYNTLFNALL